VGASIAYVAHREERLPGGQRRELFGIGTRYRELGGDEAAVVRQLKQDAHGLREPRYFRAKLTVDDPAAQRLARLSPAHRELVLRDVVEKAFRGALRTAQGVFVVHENERGNRPFGNPHVHVLLAPRLTTGEATFIPKPRLVAFRTRWDHEVLRALDRYDRRPSPERQAELEHRPDAPRRFRERTLAPRGLDVDPRVQALAKSLVRGDARGAAKAAARALPGAAGQVFRALHDLEELAQSPERAVRRRAFKVATQLVPEPIRRVLMLTQTLGLLLPKR
jgi:hypothetical protein